MGTLQKEIDRLHKEIMDSNEESLEKLNANDVEVISSSDINKIYIPDGWSEDDAINALVLQKGKKEKMVDLTREIKCYPNDGAFALKNVLEREYGPVNYESVQTPFGKIKPRITSINLPDGSTAEVPWGRIFLPMFRTNSTPDYECFIETHYDSNNFTFVIRASIRKKYEDTIKEMFSKVEKEIKENSIYRRRAIKVDLDAVSRGKTPKEPEFMEISHLNDDSFILTQEMELQLAPIYDRIQHPTECVQEGMPLKYTVLFDGMFGTGKTVRAGIISNLGQQHGWTSIYCSDSSKAKYAFELAQIYAPAIVFLEDIDRVANKNDERSDMVNDIMNTLDGVDTKIHPLITILTTNNIDNIEPGLLRAGRIDDIMYFPPMDKEAAMMMIQKECSNISDDDFTSAAESLSGMTHSFGKKTIEKAIAYRRYKARKGEDNKLTPDDVITAAKSYQKHYERSQNIKSLNENEKIGIAAKQLLSTDKFDEINDKVQELSERVEQIFS